MSESRLYLDLKPSSLNNVYFVAFFCFLLFIVILVLTIISFLFVSLRFDCFVFDLYYLFICLFLFMNRKEGCLFLQVKRV